MKTYQVIIPDTVIKQIKAYPKADAKRILKKARSLGSNPRPQGYKKLDPPYSDFYRVHVGNYRIIYQIQDDTLIVSVENAPRRNERTYK
jgi:mRNA interferase RelE/StbE